MSGSAVQQHSLMERVEFFRMDASRLLSQDQRVTLGQFFTPAPTAQCMASLFDARQSRLHLLDAGAGVGSLTAAFVTMLCERPTRPESLTVTAYEVDPLLCDYLSATLDVCRITCEQAGIAFAVDMRQEDFIEAGVSVVLDSGSLFATDRPAYTSVILNPPYRKISTRSRERALLRSIGMETSNLYTGFLAIATRLLIDGGELVAITPRSFCNGPYFKPFRLDFLQTMTLQHIHVFRSRTDAFRDDDVLQENIIVRAERSALAPPSVARPGATVIITSSVGAADEGLERREVAYAAVVDPADPGAFIHIVPDEVGASVVRQMSAFTTPLADLGLTVSTGRVVDFRAEEWLRADPGPDTAPLIYPTHLANGGVRWPKSGGRKPNGIVDGPDTADLLVPSEVYVLTRRFSAKEERRRVVASLYDPMRFPNVERVGFENHLNYYHARGRGLPSTLAKGLAVYLNSTLVDEYVRQFSGHTQVNATDLRALRYPARAVLEALGERVGDTWPTQVEIDDILRAEVTRVADDVTGLDPIAVKRRTEEALDVLRALGLPRAQQNDRSALTLLALLDLTPSKPWADASAPLRGIVQMMDWFAEHYGKQYEENTRETVRRQTIHQFRDAGLVLANPDMPTRAVNSPKNVYQIEPTVLGLLQLYGADAWDQALATYLVSRPTLAQRYAQRRAMHRIPVRVNAETTITLSPGGQNELIREIIHEFAPRWTPGGTVLYVGDADEKHAHTDHSAFATLGLSFVEGGKMPDVVIHHEAKGWLVLVEAVTSHGPVNPKRRDELARLFGASAAGLVFVTAFLTRGAMSNYLADISWETEVWVADTPDHLIHFNGERFLGPYPVSPLPT